MGFNLFNQEDPREWIDKQRENQFETFASDEVVGSHCKDCQFTPDPVIKRGSLDADLLVAGDYTAPADQETQKPFSGPAGDMLKDMLEAIDRDWETDCYVTNALLCDGTESSVRKASVQACNSNLERQLEIVSPEVVLLLGKYPFASLFGKPLSITLSDNLGYQGTLPEYPWIESVVSFNPAYILRHRDDAEKFKTMKKVAWDHLKKVKKLLETANHDESNTNDEE